MSDYNFRSSPKQQGVAGLVQETEQKIQKLQSSDLSPLASRNNPNAVGDLEALQKDVQHATKIVPIIKKIGEDYKTMLSNIENGYIVDFPKDQIRNSGQHHHINVDINAPSSHSTMHPMADASSFDNGATTYQIVPFDIPAGA